MKPNWNPTQYLKYADERERPFVDLLARVPRRDAKSLVDLGCGPGQLTPIIRDVFPQARVLGLDSSTEMIDRARQDDPETDYEVADIATWRPAEPVDAMVSNALFQWIDNRFEVIAELAESITPGGVFAIQVPSNGDAPSHRLLEEISGRDPYRQHTPPFDRSRFVNRLEDYLGLFVDRRWLVDAWTTTYAHVLHGADPVYEWVAGTGARPVIQSLPEDLRGDFVRDYQSALRQAYPEQPWGTAFAFQRTFCVAQRPQ